MEVLYLLKVYLQLFKLLRWRKFYGSYIQVFVYKSEAHSQMALAKT